LRFLYTHNRKIKLLYRDIFWGDQVGGYADAEFRQVLNRSGMKRNRGAKGKLLPVGFQSGGFWIPKWLWPASLYTALMNLCRLPGEIGGEWHPLDMVNAVDIVVRRLYTCRRGQGFSIGGSETDLIRSSGVKMSRRSDGGVGLDNVLSAEEPWRNAVNDPLAYASPASVLLASYDIN
jgi:hypothetical protein